MSSEKSILNIQNAFSIHHIAKIKKFNKVLQIFAVKNKEVSEILSTFKANILACHNFIDVGRIQKLLVQKLLVLFMAQDAE